jgi:polysaccharide transporter, PST family
MNQTSDLHSRGLRAGVWETVKAGGSSVLTLLSFVILSRILGPESFGLIAIVDATIALGQRLAEGLAEPLVQLQRLRSGHSDTLFWTLQGFGGAMVLAVVLCSGEVERFFDYAGLAELLVAASIILILRTAEAVPRALLIRDLRFNDTTQATLSAELTGGVIGISLALAGYGVWSLLYLRLAAAIVETLILWRKAAWIPHVRWSVGRFRDLWQFSASRGLNIISQFVNEQAPRIILGRAVGAAELGRFVFARQIVRSLTTILTRPINGVAMPAFSRLQDSLEDVRRLYCQGSRLSACAILPALAGVAITAPILIPLVAGSRWVDSAPIVQILSLIAYHRAFTPWNGAVLRGLGKPEWQLQVSLSRSTTTLLLILVLLPAGPAGVALAVVLSVYLSWPVAIRRVSTVTGLSARNQLRQGLPALIATLVMTAALLVIQRPLELQLAPWAATTTMIASGIVVYLAALAVVGRTELRELAGLLKNIRRAFQRRA